ncbi:MAG: cytochrome c [Deltaproteobacteria bacterium]|nr:cytochrome c [Deltaproteobacteria bacterium]
MKRVLKWLGGLLGTLVIVLITALAIIYTLTNNRMSKHYAVTVQSPPVLSGPQVLAEGERLYISRGCVDCHAKNLAGQTVVDDPIIGRFSGANLTKGQGGIGGIFTDEDFVRAIRHGVGKEGEALIFMPSTDFYAMANTEIATLIAYIRSVPPVDKPSEKQKPGPLSRLMFLLGEMPLMVTAELIDHSFKAEEVPVGVTREYGRYLANGCTGCHGPGFSGGPIPGGDPSWPPAKNLTQDATTGLKNWSEADFIKAVQTGIRPDGSKIRPPMPWENFSKLTETEVKAMWMFISTLPAKAEGGR